MTAVLLLMCCALPVFVRKTRTGSQGNVQASAQASTKPSKVALRWKTSVNGIRHMSFSPSSHHLCIITDTGETLYNTSTGSMLYTTTIPDVDQFILSPDANYAIAYSAMDSANTTCTLIDSNGRVCWKMDVGGAIWSADACKVDGGARFVVGTGSKRVYIIDISHDKKRYQRWRAPGAVVSVSLDPAGERVVVGTWQKSKVQCRSIDGDRIWELDADSANLVHVQHLHSADRIAVCSQPNKRSIDGAFALIDVDGNPIWQGAIDASGKCRVYFSPDGRYVCLGRSNLIRHKGKSTFEKHAVLLDVQGNQLWDKGSLFFQINPLLVTSAGEVLVCNEKNELFVVNGAGNPQPSIRIPSAIVESVCSRDGSLCALRCANGVVYMLRVSR
ncbi:WD40 repeat domain-containing protein [bacterium]|nr:WD40 repeat domain-containing protein [bacterium]